jgi:hypothetical protein
MHLKIQVGNVQAEICFSLIVCLMPIEVVMLIGALVTATATSTK